MTQAFNLSQLANNLNSSGQLDATDGLSGLVPLANGGTGATNTVNAITAGSGITTSVSGQTVTINSTATGTVTSVATGNGLQGGTITGSGTLSVACPTFNSVGSYCFIQASVYNGGVSAGSNYAAGSGWQQLQSSFIVLANFNDEDMNRGGDISGTWKLMSRGFGHSSNGSGAGAGIACRVS